MKPQNKIWRSELVSYGLMAAPLAFAGMPLYIHAPDFYATHYGVSLSTLAVVLLSLRIIDAIQDPLIGYISDKYVKRRATIIAVSSIFLIISFTALFQPLKSSALIWFSASMLLATTAFSILSVNLNTIGGMWSRDKTEKTRIASYREAFGLIGLLLAVVLPSAMQQMMPPSFAFGIVSILLIIIMLAALTAFLSWYNTAHFGHTQNTAGQHSAKIPAKTKLLFGIYFISILASSIPALTVLFFIRDALKAEVYTGLFLALYFLSGALGMPFWTWLSRRTDKYTAWIIGMLLAIACFGWAVFLTPETFWSYGVICVLSGLAIGSDLALPPSILADHIHESKQEQNASYFYGVLTFIAKLSLAIASITALPALDLYGYVPGKPNTPSALMALTIIYAGIPCLIKLISALTLWWSKNLMQTGEPDDQSHSINPHGNSTYSGSHHNV